MYHTVTKTKQQWYKELSSSSWWAAGRVASQETPRALQNLKHHYRVNKSPLPIPIPSYRNPTHFFMSYFFHLRFSIIILHIQWLVRRLVLYLLPFLA